MQLEYGRPVGADWSPDHRAKTWVIGGKEIVFFPDDYGRQSATGDACDALATEQQKSAKHNRWSDYEPGEKADESSVIRVGKRVFNRIVAGFLEKCPTSKKEAHSRGWLPYGHLTIATHDAKVTRVLGPER